LKRGGKKLGMKYLELRKGENIPVAGFRRNKKMERNRGQGNSYDTDARNRKR